MTIAQLNAAPGEGVEYVFPLPHSPRAVSTVRRRAEAVLTRWSLPTGAAEDVLLVISELLTNAVVHAVPPAALRLSSTLLDGRRAVRVAVTDMGPAALACGSSATIDPDEHGRGLCIVAALSARYGVEVHPEGASRWAEVLAG
ncbi:ATP-binding protein [Streptomyces chiangmaiensis]|uniref:ATP-binding protein n=1 Tax=Streptomyces chiangmaiensis TaxID=766497 RepID=A0ABU7FXZ8_9ACTN|nr:ATP-binding protein [Streptomyces chiangmaiensis]MED7827949.1 ATP-binding protein [Streptomyces chiangmaiensis]